MYIDGSVIARSDGNSFARAVCFGHCILTSISKSHATLEQVMRYTWIKRLNSNGVSDHEMAAVRLRVVRTILLAFTFTYWARGKKGVHSVDLSLHVSRQAANLFIAIRIAKLIFVQLPVLNAPAGSTSLRNFSTDRHTISAHDRVSLSSDHAKWVTTRNLESRTK
ncbi:hypothetical protein BDU57DRAFT_31534 [Ampelomyces quisqualis]|uniref:Uncharacterized protein n=1 Tax=Ampelomyces quisqualis TaxID=50730 RepID=A0A6A5R1Z7_AMPQU|nr:hypothetical protein BDU57DRAFT_31534 [Ampelomyces quisqualis]